MPVSPSIQLRAAGADDAAFIAEIARHACVIEDWPLPEPDDEEVLSLLPPGGEVPVLAITAAGRRVGAVWTFHSDPPLRVVAGVSLPELCIAVTAHVRNPARRLHVRTGFRVAGPGRGALGIAMLKNLR